MRLSHYSFGPIYIVVETTVHAFGVNCSQNGLEGDSTLDPDQERSSGTECLYSILYALYQLDSLKSHTPFLDVII